MGRFWLGAGLLALFLVLGLWTGSAMEEVHTQIAQTLEDAAQQARTGNLDQGVFLAKQAQAQWEAQWHSTASVADHAPMDEIDSLFAQLQSYGQTGQTEDFAAYCVRLSRLVAAVGEAHSLSWWNML